MVILQLEVPHVHHLGLVEPVVQMVPAGVSQSGKAVAPLCQHELDAAVIGPVLRQSPEAVGVLRRVVQAQQGLLTIGDDLQQAGVEILCGPIGDGGGLAEPDPEGHITLPDPIHRRPEHDGRLAAAAVAGEDGGSAIGKDLCQPLVDVLVDHIAAAGDDP